MKVRCSRGLNDIPINFLKYDHEVIVKPFIHVLTSAVQLFNTFPDVLKTGKVIHIYKKGDRSTYENFSPIGLLIYLSRIAEKVVST